MVPQKIVVLVVEDEALIRMSLVEELQDAGLVVHGASDADEAIRIFNSEPSIEAIFSDIDMPGSMNGIKFAEMVQKSRPNVAILLTSGYLKVPKSRLPATVPFLPKPYAVDRVVDHIRELVAR